MSRLPLPVAPRALAALACTVALAACVVTPPTTPGADGGDAKVSKPDPRKTAAPSPGATTAASSAASPAPIASAAAGASTGPEAPLPSLGLLLAGQVKLDPSAMLKLGIAERTSLGVKLISNNGPGLISDKGVGLISDKGVGLISNNSGSIVSKTKYALAQASAGRAPLPVQGLIVQAISLRTGEVLAGPIATDAEGRYRLGFLARPESNLAIVAYVNNKDEDDFRYAAFAQPTETAVTTTDTTDLICEYMIRVLAGRVQVNLDRRIRGEDVWVDPELTTSEAERKQADDLNRILEQITPEMAKTLDNEGKTARTFAERTVSFVDLSKPVFAELHSIFDRLVAFDASLATPPTPSVQDEVATLLYDVRTLDRIPAALQKHGMSQAEAESLATRLRNTAAELNSELARVGNEHPAEVFGPLLEIPGIGSLLPLFESPAPSPTAP